MEVARILDFLSFCFFFFSPLFDSFRMKREKRHRGQICAPALWLLLCDSADSISSVPGQVKRDYIYWKWEFVWRKKPLSLVCPINALRSLVSFLEIDCS